MSERGTTPTRRGFTLIEATFSLIIVSGVVLAAMSTVGAASRLDATRRNREMALALAHEMMAEVLRMHYADPETAELADTPNFGLEADETTGDPPLRTGFDDIDDYASWSASPPTDPSGKPLPGAEGFTRSVVVEFAVPNDPTGPGNADPFADTGLKRIEIRVSPPVGGEVVLTALRTPYGSYDTEPTVESTYIRSVIVEIQLGEEGRRLTTGAAVLNQIAGGDVP